MTADAFLSKLEQIVGDNLRDGDFKISFPTDTAEQISASLLRIKRMEGELRILEKEIGMRMKDIKSSHATSSARVGESFGAVITGLFLGRKTAGRQNALKRDSLRTQKLRALAPYENLRGVIDRIQHEIAVSREELKLLKQGLKQTGS